jgi:hypothetical protein
MIGSVMAVMVFKGFREEEDANVRYRKDDIRVMRTHGYRRIMVLYHYRLNRALIVGERSLRRSEGREWGLRRYLRHGKNMYLYR